MADKLTSIDTGDQAGGGTVGGIEARGETMGGTRGAVDPAAEYTPAELAEAVGRTTGYVYRLIADGLLTARRTRPGGRGRLAISGADWLAFAASCVVGPGAVRARREARRPGDAPDRAPAARPKPRTSAPRAPAGGDWARALEQVRGGG